MAAAAELFDEHGFHGTSLQEVAEAAGISKAAIYHHFRTKDEILVEILRTLMDRVLDRHRDRHRNDDRPALEMLRGMIGDLMEVVEQHPAHLRVVLEQVRHLPADLQDELAEGRRRFQTEIRDILEIGTATGEFTVEDDPSLVAAAILGACWAYFWHPPQNSFRAQNLADVVTRLVLQGLQPRT
ncbi:TetR/AcrR family transcriptional regulator [Streptomyces sp. NPDC006285]|uniref:TetR/AcrR family transcriptional regulator n=1 Tax=Streptomyces sp. NPDC006285 TaxID=3364742 RepID=UPI003677CB7F